MKKHFWIDCIAYTALKLLGPMIRVLPPEAALLIGSGAGELFFRLDYKHRATAYANIKQAFGEKLPPKKILAITRAFYHSFGRNFIELFFIPRFNKEYLDKHLSVAGLENVEKALARGKGVIFLSIHAGAWEFSNHICAYLKLPFVLFVRDQQRYPRLNRLLNSFRTRQGCRIIQKDNFLRQMVEALKKNEIIGMTADQGGKSGVLVDFFGRSASMSAGAVKLALKYGSAIVPVFYRRKGGANVEVHFIQAFQPISTGDEARDIRDNLQKIISIFERQIELYPAEYLWSYKIWKYSSEKSILILSDGKAGHLRQSQALSGLVTRQLNSKDIGTTVESVEIKFKNAVNKALLKAGGIFSGKYNCQGCLSCLSRLLDKDTWTRLVRKKPDIVISCGSGLALVNYLISRENLAKSLVVMRPSFLSARRFDLVIMPRHDRPPQRKNVVAIEGALNLINEPYLKEQAERLIHSSCVVRRASCVFIGLLIGGDSKGFILRPEVVSKVIRGIKSAAEKLGADILLTTSRRTSSEIERLVKAEFAAYAGCKLLVIANEKNLPEAVGGILGLSSIVVVSPESISMVSEAASSGRQVLVFDHPGLGKKHRSFLARLAEGRRITFKQPGEAGQAIEDILKNRPRFSPLQDNALVLGALEKIL